ncbi:MAG: hypothetical protein QGG09_05055 [Pirellulaceae bacterium]|nr:hypothetical protein [Pirellulaceae bacterium]
MIVPSVSLAWPADEQQQRTALTFWEVMRKTAGGAKGPDDGS